MCHNAKHSWSCQLKHYNLSYTDCRHTLDRLNTKSYREHVFARMPLRVQCHECSQLACIIQLNNRRARWKNSNFVNISKNIVLLFLFHVATVHTCER